MPKQPYVSRPEAEAFLDDLDKALKDPAKSPVVFHGWGIGGVGKSTLTRKVKDAQGDAATIAEVSFGLTEGIEEPIPLMAKLYEQIAVKDSWSRDPFWDKYELYFQTIHQLNTQAASGRGDATPEQVGQVKTLLQLGVDVAGEFFLSESGKKTASTLVDKGMEAAVAGLSLKDGLQQLLQQHKATKRDLELQAFMLEPLPHLTRAFAAGLSQHTQHKPIILVLDTYEKAPSVIDTWLWRTLLGNTEVSAQPVRLLITGRHCLLKTEGWRKLHQDRHVVQDLTIERFSPAQTKDYLAQIDITDETQVETIGRVTRGLPYYLNWIREQTAKGRTLNFDQGNQEIVRLLLQDLNDTQTRVVQLAACCRWFDAATIRYVAETWGLDFASAVDDSLNCYDWLTQQSFVEPVGKRWRLDDVARDVFRQSLEPDDLETAHEILAQYFLDLSNKKVPADSPSSDKYGNPEWREPRAEYLYHLLFTARQDTQPQYVSHLFEGCYLQEDSVIRQPYSWVLSESPFSEKAHLPYQNKQFLETIKPAVDHSYLVFEWSAQPQETATPEEDRQTLQQMIESIENPASVPLEQRQEISLAITQLTSIFSSMGVPVSNDQQLKALLQQMLPMIEANPAMLQLGGTLNQQTQILFERLGVSMAEVEAAVDLCFRQTNDLNGLGKCVALIYQAKRQSPARQVACLIAAKQEATQYITFDFVTFGEKLLVREIGPQLRQLDQEEEAIAAYDAALAIKPDKHEALYNKGVALGNLGRYKEAIAAFDAALAIQPDNHEALYNKGVALFNLGRYEEAIAAYDAALAIQPDNHEALNNKGLALDDLGRHEEAIAAYDAALAIKPDKHEALYNKGIALGNLGRHEEAIAAYDAALAIKPDKHEALYNKGIALRNLGRYEEAIAAYDAALAIKPDKHEALNNKGIALRNLGRYEEAIAAYDAALAIKPDNHEALNNKGVALDELGRYEEAIAAYDAALAIQPDKHEALYNKGIALGNLGRYEEAIAAFDAALAIQPDDHEALNNKGVALGNLGRYEEAIAAYDAALAIQPDDHDAAGNNKGVCSV
jgi:tetratricopeptide (TPR) repeat protein